MSVSRATARERRSNHAFEHSVPVDLVEKGLNCRHRLALLNKKRKPPALPDLSVKLAGCSPVTWV
jgi:hypothetical protein